MGGAYHTDIAVNKNNIPYGAANGRNKKINQRASEMMPFLFAQVQEQSDTKKAASFYTYRFSII
jgi:hypothetical protein